MKVKLTNNKQINNKCIKEKGELLLALSKMVLLGFIMDDKQSNYNKLFFKNLSFLLKRKIFILKKKKFIFLKNILCDTY
jgi:hypothetical protein